VREPDEPAQPADVPSDVEHELINSLASMVGFSELIRRDPSLPDDLRHNADLLAKEATRTRHLVGELLDLVRRPSPEPHRAAVSAPIDSGRGGAPATMTTSATRPRVLVLDNEPSMRVFLDKALTLLGYEPVIASLGPDAVAQATAGDHAALLFDHQMAGMSGTEAYDAIIAVRPDLATRVVMMSGDLLDPELEAFAEDHAVTLLAKPFDLDTLDRTIRTVMEATGQSRG
jgi:CheY-like chemotaxis protein